MSSKSYFRASFLLPVVLPLVVEKLAWMFSGFRTPADDTTMAKMVEVLYLPLLLGGIPYVIFLLAVLLWSRRRDAAKIFRFTFFAPWAFIPVLGGYDILSEVVAAKAGLDLTNVISGVEFLSLFVLVYGYGYVVLAHGGYILLRISGTVEDDARAAV